MSQQSPINNKAAHTSGFVVCYKRFFSDTTLFA